MKRILSILLSAVILSSTACLTACGITLPKFNKTAHDEVGEQTTAYIQDEPIVPELPVISTEKETDEQTGVNITPSVEIPNGTTTTEKVEREVIDTGGYEAGDDIDSLLTFLLTEEMTEYKVRILDKTATEIEIPQYYKGLPVTEIDDGAFVGCNLISIHIPNSVKVIGNNAFMRCMNLEMVTGMEGVTKLGVRAFAFCSSLDRIILPITLTELGSNIFRAASTTVFIRKTEKEMKALNSGWDGNRNKNARTVYVGPDIPSGDEAELDEYMNFEPIRNGTEYSVYVKGAYDKSDLIIPKTYYGKPVTVLWRVSADEISSVFIPDSVIEISGMAFSICHQLQSVTGMNNLKRIGSNAFIRTNIKSLELPDCLTFLGSGAFVDCVELESIELPASLTYIGGATFGSCEKLESIIMPPRITIIEPSTFAFCSNLKNIVFPSDLTYIGIAAFTHCTALESIILPAKLTHIDSRAFENCTSLKNVFFPSSIEFIHERAFNNSGISLI